MLRACWRGWRFARIDWTLLERTRKTTMSPWNYTQRLRQQREQLIETFWSSITQKQRRKVLARLLILFLTIFWHRRSGAACVWVVLPPRVLFISKAKIEEWENSLLGSCFLKYHFWWKSGINSERKWDYLGNVMWRYCNDFWRKMGGVPAQQSWSVVTGKIINRLKCTCLLPFRVLIFFVNEKERNSEGLQRFVSDTCRYCSKRSWVSYCWLTLLIVFTI